MKEIRQLNWFPGFLETYNFGAIIIKISFLLIQNYRSKWKQSVFYFCAYVYVILNYKIKIKQISKLFSYF